MSSGIGVERTFPVYAPSVTKIEVLRRGSVRRSKLYYLRQLTGKSARIKEKVRGLSYVQKQEAAIAEKKAAASAAVSGTVQSPWCVRDSPGESAPKDRSCLVIHIVSSVKASKYSPDSLSLQMIH